MSNHEQKPDQNANSSVNEQIPHSGVHGYETPHREYDKTPLSEAPLSIRPRDVSDTGMLPDALQVMPSRKKWYERTSVRIGGAVAGLVAAGGVALGAGAFSNGGSDKAPTTPESSTSAKQVPGEANEADSSTESPEAIIGQPGSTLENISVKPSQELVEEALQPVTVTEFPTSEDALKQFGRIDNIIDLSATVDTDSGSTLFPETAESITQREALFRNIFTDEGYNTIEKDSQVPAIVAMELWFINKSGAISPDTTGTWHVEWIPEHIEAHADNTYDVEITKRITTNFHELDDMIYQNLPTIKTTSDFPVQIELSNDGEVWKVDSWKSLS